MGSNLGRNPWVPFTDIVKWRAVRWKGVLLIGLSTGAKNTYGKRVRDVKEKKAVGGKNAIL